MGGQTLEEAGAIPAQLLAPPSAKSDVEEEELSDDPSSQV